VSASGRSAVCGCWQVVQNGSSHSLLLSKPDDGVVDLFTLRIHASRRLSPRLAVPGIDKSRNGGDLTVLLVGLLESDVIDLFHRRGVAARIALDGDVPTVVRDGVFVVQRLPRAVDDLDNDVEAVAGRTGFDRDTLRRQVCWVVLRFGEVHAP